MYEENYGLSFDKYASGMPTAGGEMIHVFIWASSMVMEMFDKRKKEAAGGYYWVVQ